MIPRSDGCDCSSRLGGDVSDIGPDALFPRGTSLPLMVCRHVGVLLSRGSRFMEDRDGVESSNREGGLHHFDCTTCPEDKGG